MKKLLIVLVIPFLLCGCFKKGEIIVEPYDFDEEPSTSITTTNSVCNLKKGTLTDKKPGSECKYEEVELTWEWMKTKNGRAWKFYDKDGLVDTPKEYKKFMPTEDGKIINKNTGTGEKVTKTIYKIK